MRFPIDTTTGTGLVNALGCAYDNESDTAKENTTCDWLLRTIEKIELSGSEARSQYITRGVVDLDPLDVAMIWQFIPTFCEFIVVDAGYTDQEVEQARAAEAFAQRIQFPYLYHIDYLTVATDCLEWEWEECRGEDPERDRHGVMDAMRKQDQLVIDIDETLDEDA